MIAFLDFEASSLSKKSVPIEVAWVFQDGRSRSLLIKPHAMWDDWSAEAEAIHGISKEQLSAEGTSVDLVAGEMIEFLTGHDLYASAPSWDGKWLSALLRAAGHPRHLLRLGKSKDAFRIAARDFLGTEFSDVDITSLVDNIVEDSRHGEPVSHRALPDAMLELARWNRVREAAEQMDGITTLT